MCFISVVFDRSTFILLSCLCSICRIHMFGITDFRIFHHGEFAGEGRLWKRLQRCDRRFLGARVNQSFPVCCSVTPMINEWLETSCWRSKTFGVDQQRTTAERLMKTHRLTNSKSTKWTYRQTTARVNVRSPEIWTHTPVAKETHQSINQWSVTPISIIWTSWRPNLPRTRTWKHFTTLPGGAVPQFYICYYFTTKPLRFVRTCW